MTIPLLVVPCHMTSTWLSLTCQCQGMLPQWQQLCLLDSSSASGSVTKILNDPFVLGAISASSASLGITRDSQKGHLFPAESGSRPLGTGPAAGYWCLSSKMAFKCFAKDPSFWVIFDDGGQNPAAWVNRTGQLLVRSSRILSDHGTTPQSLSGFVLDLSASTGTSKVVMYVSFAFLLPPYDPACASCRAAQNPSIVFGELRGTGQPHGCGRA